jgi:hypothetical protein
VIRAAALVFLLAAPTTSTLDRKFALIEQDHQKPGSRVVMTRAEWSAWVAEAAPTGVTHVRIDLGMNRITASANVDFLKADRARGDAPNWLMTQLLEGDRPVTVTARIQSGNGRVRVDLERVQISGVAIEGKTLDFLIQEFVIPSYPGAKLSQWVPLAHRMDRIEIEPKTVTVVLR